MHVVNWFIYNVNKIKLHDKFVNVCFLRLPILLLSTMVTMINQKKYVNCVSEKTASCMNIFSPMLTISCWDMGMVCIG